MHQYTPDVRSSKAVRMRSQFRCGTVRGPETMLRGHMRASKVSKRHRLHCSPHLNLIYSNNKFGSNQPPALALAVLVTPLPTTMSSGVTTPLSDHSTDDSQEAAWKLAIGVFHTVKLDEGGDIFDLYRFPLPEEMDGDFRIPVYCNGYLGLPLSACTFESYYTNFTPRRIPAPHPYIAQNVDRADEVVDRYFQLGDVAYQRGTVCFTSVSSSIAAPLTTSRLRSVPAARTSSHEGSRNGWARLHARTPTDVDCARATPAPCRRDQAGKFAP